MDKKVKQKTSKGIYILIGCLWFISLLIFFVCRWGKSVFDVGIEEFIFTISTPIDGVESSVVGDGIISCAPPVIIGMILYGVFVFIDIKLRNKEKELKYLRHTATGVAIVVFIASIYYLNSLYNISGYVKNCFSSTLIYDQHYVNPESAGIVADGDEKNLIFIYLESMETTYASKAEGGNQKESYIPNLVKLANENISFSDGAGIGGFLAPIGASWTTGALLATSSGVPLSNSVRDYVKLDESFAQGLTAIGDILEKHGYNQVFLCGSEAEFGGRKTLFQQHGNYEIADLLWARQKGYVPADYDVWWGFEDKYLFEIAKKELPKLAKKGKPFNYTMITADTHHVGGYVCDICENIYDSDTANVVACTDRLVYDFIAWCERQPWYKDTLIVIIGDHPRMDTNLVKGVPEKDRTMYNCFINCDFSGPLNNKNRIFTSMDIFPTTLTAMGFEYEGNRLGLGTDMFSGRKTLAEEIGFDVLQAEIKKNSEYYSNNFN